MCPSTRYRRFHSQLVSDMVAFWRIPYEGGHGSGNLYNPSEVAYQLDLDEMIEMNETVRAFFRRSDVMGIKMLDLFEAVCH